MRKGKRHVSGVSGPSRENTEKKRGQKKKRENSMRAPKRRNKRNKTGREEGVGGGAQPPMPRTHTHQQHNLRETEGTHLPYPSSNSPLSICPHFCQNSRATTKRKQCRNALQRKLHALLNGLHTMARTQRTLKLREKGGGDENHSQRDRMWEEVKDSPERTQR
jgi:hypothetical protein